MEAALQSLGPFAQALQAASNSEAGCSLHLSVRYRGDSAIYRGWPFPKGNYVTTAGLADPGFGSGPVAFSDIVGVRVYGICPEPRRASPTYYVEFNELCAAVAHLPGVEITAESITLGEL